MWLCYCMRLSVLSCFRCWPCCVLVCGCFLCVSVGVVVCLVVGVIVVVGVVGVDCGCGFC